MAMTEYQYAPEWLASELAQKKINLLANLGLSDIVSFGLKNINNRINKDRRRYLDYGPYWWAIKEALNTAGYSYGDESDKIVRTQYQGKSIGETLIAAEAFRNDYLATQFIYTNKFILDLSTSAWYLLADSDME
jgi:hypothetical protein